MILIVGSELFRDLLHKDPLEKRPIFMDLSLELMPRFAERIIETSCTENPPVKLLEAGSINRDPQYTNPLSLIWLDHGRI